MYNSLCYDSTEKSSRTRPRVRKIGPRTGLRAPFSVEPAIGLQVMILTQEPVPSGRAGLKSALDCPVKPLKAAALPPGSRFSDFLTHPVTASARHGKAT